MQVWMIGLVHTANLVVTVTTGGEMSIIIGGSSVVRNMSVFMPSMGTDVTSPNLDSRSVRQRSSSPIVFVVLKLAPRSCAGAAAAGAGLDGGAGAGGRAGVDAGAAGGAPVAASGATNNNSDMRTNIGPPLAV